MTSETTRQGTPARRRHERQGRLAETIAAWYLRLAGYRILARRVRTPVGELDIVARRGPTLAIVEVKSRSDPAAGEVLTFRQRQRISRAALFFLARLPDHANLAVRYDLVLVRPWRWPRHLANAWRDGD
jgi:putative endonuclease